MTRRIAAAAFAVCVLCLAATTGFQLLIARELHRSGSQTATGLLDTLVSSLIFFAFPAVGFLIARRRPANAIGWLLLGVGLCWGMRSALFDGYLRWTLARHPRSLLPAELVGSLTFPLWVPAVGLMGTFLILLFPDGHLPSPRWRPVGWICALTLGGLYVIGVTRPGPVAQAPVPDLRNALAINALLPVRPALDTLALLLPLCILACAAALVMRFRRSLGVERLQVKWLATAGALVACSYLLLMSMSAYAAVTHAGPAPRWFNVLVDVTTTSFVLIPLAIGVAVLKHGLYGIDVVINKAVVFGALAAFITGVYVAIVVGIGAAIGQGNHSLALSIAATAVVAIAFQPVRERVQRLANRLVYGSRATPYEVLSDLASRMGGTYASADLLPRMARTIAEGTGAARVEVWLRIGSELICEVSWPAPGQPRAHEAVPVAEDQLPVLDGDRVVPVRHHGELLGVIAVSKQPGEPVTPTEDKLLDDVAAQAGLVLRNVRLIEELRSSRERLVRTQDVERRRLERNLHDGAQQSLVSVALILRMARARVSAERAPIGAAIDEASQQLTTAIEELRELARGIHPAILTERGIGPAITSLAERARLPISVDITPGDRLPATIEGTVYFVVSEALTNITKHAQATSASITIEHADDTLTTTITDDGTGGANPDSGSGLSGLADRVAAVDGELHIFSPQGGGTRVTCRIPVHQHVAALAGGGSSQ